MLKIRVRQLPNGKWIGELKTWLFGSWYASEPNKPEIGWRENSRGHGFWRGCQVNTEEEARKSVEASAALYKNAGAK